MAIKHALGRGLSTLIPDASRSSVQGPQPVFEIPLDKVTPNPAQPRKEFNALRQEELIESIREKGILQPILVRQVGSGYEVIAGERRYRAAMALGWGRIPAVVKTAQAEEALELALIENIQRQDLNPMEEAKAFDRLLNEFDMTQEQVAKALGKDRSSIGNTVRLLGLPEKMQEKVLSGEISTGHAKVLLSVADMGVQEQVFNRILKEKLSVRQAEQVLREVQPDKAQATRKVARDRDPHLQHLEEEIQRVLGTRVRISKVGKGGRVQIEYYSSEDLDRLLGALGISTR